MKSKGSCAFQRVCTHLTDRPCDDICVSGKGKTILSLRNLQRVKAKPLHIPDLAGISKACILISKGPGTHSPKRGHRADINKMKDQRWSQYCHHSSRKLLFSKYRAVLQMKRVTEMEGADGSALRMYTVPTVHLKRLRW